MLQFSSMSSVLVRPCDSMPRAYNTNGQSEMRCQALQHENSRYGADHLPFLLAFPHSRWRRVRVLLHRCRRWRAWRDSVDGRQDIGAAAYTDPAGQRHCTILRSCA